MRINLVGGPIHDVNAAAVALPAGDAGGEVLVGVGDAAVVLFFVFVFDGVGRGIAAQPELLDEVIAFLVVGKLLEGGALFVGDDPAHALVEPVLVRLAQLFLQALGVFALLL